ncbi:hypothetical protein VP1G_02227 [Cytospora mali]|uniref:Cryptic loci regulator 2 N-terminal domain-containing protein n=1 Tax=Cytospora mali TaxID=578113 RepID=A0A194UT95_CYTMA|nr:hypothetical protein VP1G_02227 [Valsa mali var. pyri (nom. inval.)]
MAAPTAGAGAAPRVARQVHVGRSDGRVYSTEEINARRKTAAKQVGEPIPEDFNQIADVETRKKVLLWKLVVATGLSEELGWPQDSQYQLVFPEGYCLRWQNPAGQKKEACVFGHPQDCSEEFAYKHPHEFIPHVMWLLSDSQDHKDCPCQPCHIATGRKWPQTLKAKYEKKAAALAASEAKAKKAAAASAKPATATRKRASATTSAASSPTPELVAKPPKETAVATKPTKKPAASKAPVSAPAPSVQPAPASTAPHPAINNEPTLFRRGEMVWFQQGPAWRIGIIREVGAGQTPAYMVIPLAHSSLAMVDVEKQAQEMRPFLTFSVPSVAIPELQDKLFTQVDWQALIKTSGQRPEFIGLEASKMAALEIDGSWSTFNRLSVGPKQPQNQSVYGGVFLGAEMIRLGDPIRNREKGRGILEVTEITVTTTATAPDPADPANTPPTTTHALSFRGIEYEAALKCVWTIKSWDTVWGEREVGGRLYVTHELIGVTQGTEAADAALRTGQFQEATAYLNNRMQNAHSRDFGRRMNRRATIGAAVAPSPLLVFGEGLLEE